MSYKLFLQGTHETKLADTRHLAKCLVSSSSPLGSGPELKSLSQRKKEYELRTGGNTVLKQAMTIQNFGQDPLGAELWVHFLIA